MVLRTGGGIEGYAHVDASFAVHDDMKSHTGTFITLGSRPVWVSSKKQKQVTNSSTKAELVGISDCVDS